MRRMVFKAIHDRALMVDGMLQEREVVPSAGIVDIQSVKPPAADKRAMTPTRRSRAASGISPSSQMRAC